MNNVSPFFFNLFHKCMTTGKIVFPWVIGTPLFTVPSALDESTGCQPEFFWRDSSTPSTRTSRQPGDSCPPQSTHYLLAYYMCSVQWEERFMIIPWFVLTTVAQIATILILSPYNLHHLRLQYCDILNDILYYFIDPIK